MSPRACPLEYPALPRPYHILRRKPRHLVACSQAEAVPVGLLGTAAATSRAGELLLSSPHFLTVGCAPQHSVPPAPSCCPALGAPALLALGHGVFRGLYAGLWPAPLPGPRDAVVTLPRRPQEPLCCCCPVQAGGDGCAALTRQCAFLGATLGGHPQNPCSNDSLL